MPFLRTYITILFISCSLYSSAQRSAKDSIISSIWFGAQYGFNLTAGDLAEKHGNFNHLGIFAGYKTNKNWVFGFDGSFMFGNDVRVEGLFDHLVDSKGFITDQNGDRAIVVVYSRGYYLDGTIGKIFPVFGPNKNSGIYFNLGAGWLAHKIRVETQDHVVPELELDYRKGYDRLTSGLNTQEFLGYAFMANRGIVNFYGGFYCQQGYTYNRRTIFFDKPNEPVSTDMMLDIQYGLKVCWLIPVYKRQPKEFYFN